MGSICCIELNEFTATESLAREYGFNTTIPIRGKILTFVTIVERITTNKTVLILNDGHEYLIKSELPCTFIKNDQVHVLYTDNVDIDGNPYRCIRQIYNTENNILFMI